MREILVKERDSVHIELLDKTVVKRRSEQQFSVIDNEVVMLNISKAEYYALNAVASRIWDLIEKPVTIEKLVFLLLEEFDVDPEVCRNETIQCLEDFVERELVEVQNA